MVTCMCFSGMLFKNLILRFLFTSLKSLLPLFRSCNDDNQQFHSHPVCTQQRARNNQSSVDSLLRWYIICVVYFFLFFINVLPSSRWKFLFRFFFNYLRNAIKIFVVSKVFVSVKKADFNQWKRFLGAKLSGFLCVKRVYGMYVCVIWAELATIQPIECSTCVKTNEKNCIYSSDFDYISK